MNAPFNGTFALSRVSTLLKTSVFWSITLKVSKYDCKISVKKSTYVGGPLPDFLFYVILLLLDEKRPHYPMIPCRPFSSKLAY